MILFGMTVAAWGVLVTLSALQVYNNIAFHRTMRLPGVWTRPRECFELSVALAELNALYAELMPRLAVLAIVVQLVYCLSMWPVTACYNGSCGTIGGWAR